MAVLRELLETIRQSKKSSSVHREHTGVQDNGIQAVGHREHSHDVGGRVEEAVKKKIHDVEGTKIDGEFLDIERKLDVANKAVAKIPSKATEYLQPNSANRDKLGMLSTVSKIPGQVRTSSYPQGGCLQGALRGLCLGNVFESMKLMT